MTRTVTITGATGFIGGALAHALAAQGHTITALVRSGSDRSRLSGLDIQFVEGDITDPASFGDAFVGAEWVVHAAGMLGQSGIPEEAYHQVHVEGTRNLLAAARDNQRILYISSPGVLGPITGAPATEMSPLAPSNPYERSKARAEAVALEAARRGKPVVIARPEFVYGPGDTHVLGLFQTVQKGLFFYIDRGRALCQPTYIEDAVDGLLRCLEEGRPGDVYHITGPEPVTFRQLAETIANALSVTPPRLALPRSLAWLGASFLEAAGRLAGRTPPLSRTGVDFFSEDRYFSWEKAQQQLGYQPRFPLDKGVQRTVEWYRERGFL